MILSNVKSSAGPRRLRDLWYGEPGVGKSTLASKTPDPLWISLDNGINHLDVPVYPQRPRTFAELREALQVVRKEPHKYRTLVIDTIDEVERMIAADVAATYRGDKGQTYKTIAAIPYYAGYSVAIDQCWRPLLADLELLQAERQMHVVLLAWSRLGTGAAMDTEEAKTWQPNLQTSKNASALNTVCGWAENVLFLSWARFAKDDKMVATPQRVVKTQGDGQWIAKNRWGLPSEISSAEGPQGLWNELKKHMVPAVPAKE